MTRKLLIVFTDSEDTARTLSDVASQYDLHSEVISSVALLFTDREEDFLELLLDMNKETVKSFRYLLIKMDTDVKVDVSFLLKQVPHTLSLEELIDRLIYSVIGDVFYEVRILFHPIIDLKKGG